MSGPADAQNLYVYAAVGLDFLLVVFTELGDLGPLDLPVGDVDVFLGNINMVKQVYRHVVVVRLVVVVLDRVILVQVKCDYILK